MPPRPPHSAYRLCRTYQHFIIRPGGQLQRALGAARSLRADGQQPSVNVLILLVFFIKARSEPSNIEFFHRFHFRAPIENLIQTLFLLAPNIELSCRPARSHALTVLPNRTDSYKRLTGGQLQRLVMCCKSPAGRWIAAGRKCTHFTSAFHKGQQ